MFKKNLYSEQSRNENILTVSLKWRLSVGFALLVWMISIVINSHFMRLSYFRNPNEIIHKMNFYASVIIVLWLTIRLQFLYNNSPRFIWVVILSTLGSAIPITELFIGAEKIMNMEKSNFFNLLFLSFQTVIVVVFTFINTHKKKIGAVFIGLDLGFLIVISLISNLFNSKYAMIPLFIISLAFVLLQFFVTNTIYDEGYIWTELSILLMVGVIGAQTQVPLKWSHLLDTKTSSWITLVLLLFVVPLIATLIFKKLGKYNQVISFSPLIFMPLICLIIFYLHGDILEVKKIKFIAYSLFMIFYLFLHFSKIAYKTIQKRVLLLILLVWIHLFVLVLVLGFYTPQEIYLAIGINVDLITTIIFGFSTSLIVTILTVLDLRWLAKQNKPKEKVGD
ncbi:hypothetical protein [Mycoplasma todarodis]|uniref:Uncharacterized protein n=1 Tax=Mycoplasma todarodis TaxID=1937191 RepID=A0A4R0XR40_9MOLU|nr:hypothetical protein [Mycoplasma todarodis]TCG12070.1 hypothetical protein C4B25_00045 [Mycoplasma todarodis]